MIALRRVLRSSARVGAGIALALLLGLVAVTFARPAAADDPTVLITGFAYSPATITVPAGTTITWRNDDATAHSATEISGLPIFDSVKIATGGLYSYTFTTPGTYEYTCIYHAFMRGTVIVTDGGAAIPPATDTATAAP